METETRNQINMRLTASDAEVLARLQRRTGLNPTGVIRLALRTLDAQGIAERRQTVNEVTFVVGFESGYEATASIERETAMTSEYWVEITQRQNPYDLSDEPVSVDGVELDSDGSWMDGVDRKLAAAFGVNTEQLYH